MCELDGLGGDPNLYCIHKGGDLLVYNFAQSMLHVVIGLGTDNIHVENSKLQHSTTNIEGEALALLHMVEEDLKYRQIPQKIADDLFDCVDSLSDDALKRSRLCSVMKSVRNDLIGRLEGDDKEYDFHAFLTNDY